MTKLIVVRHGQSIGNREGIIQGKRGDFELTEDGIKQGEKAALVLKNEKIDAIYSSPLKRALQTAKIINKYHNLEINIKSGLAERDYGTFTGLKKNKLSPEQKEIFDKRHIEDFKLPEGECILDQKKRVREVIEEILEKNKDKTILIVVHAGTKRCILREFAGLSQEDLSVKIPNTGITELEIKDGKVKVLKLFSKDHLETMDEPKNLF